MFLSKTLVKIETSCIYKEREAGYKLQHKQEPQHSWFPLRPTAVGFSSLTCTGTDTECPPTMLLHS